MKTITKSFYHFTPLLWRGRERFFYIILFLSLPTLCSAQKIYFTDPTNFWEVKETYTFASSLPNYYYYDFWYGADTTIGSTTYKKMLCTDSSRGYVREDTSLGIVYYYNTTNSSEDTLYNYNLRLGDTIAYNTNVQYVKDSLDKYDSILINGVYYKRYNFDCLYCNQYQFTRRYTLIEGLGSTSGPLFPTALGACNNGVALLDFQILCFSENGNAPNYTIPANNDCSGGETLTNLAICFPTAVNKNQLDYNVQIYPNPAKYILALRWANNVSNETIKISISNMLGQVVYNNTLQSKQTNLDISVTTWNSGIYYIELTNENGKKEIKKIMKE